MITYGAILDDVNYLSRFGVETGAIGASEYGRMIPYVHLRGEGLPVLVTAGIHAREHVSSLYCLKQIYKLWQTPHNADLWFVPLVNPDGNVLVAEGAEAFGFDTAHLIALNGGSTDFSLWKANARGVDINVNFDARWGEGTQNVRTAGSENYIGEAPFCSAEAKALRDFTLKVHPALTLSYHAKGREIYYDFYQTGNALARDRALAAYAARLTGYTLIEGTRGSAGGYKDWCVSALGIPSLTIELCDDALAHPLPDTAILPDFARAPLLPEQLHEFLVTQK